MSMSGPSNASSPPQCTVTSFAWREDYHPSDKALFNDNIDTRTSCSSLYQLIRKLPPYATVTNMSLRLCKGSSCTVKAVIKEKTPRDAALNLLLSSLNSKKG